MVGHPVTIKEPYHDSLPVAMLTTGKHKDRALLTALTLEFLSRNLRRVPSPSSTVERDEYARRDRDLVWYLLRGSVWDSYTR